MLILKGSLGGVTQSCSICGLTLAQENKLLRAQCFSLGSPRIITLPSFSPPFSQPLYACIHILYVCIYMFAYICMWLYRFCVHALWCLMVDGVEIKRTLP